MNKVTLFLILAVAIATGTFLLIGVLLLPALGVGGTARTMICGGISGGAIAIIYLNMFKAEVDAKVKSENEE